MCKVSSGPNWLNELPPLHLPDKWTTVSQERESLLLTNFETCNLEEELPQVWDLKIKDHKYVEHNPCDPQEPTQMGVQREGNTDEEETESEEFIIKLTVRNDRHDWE